MPATRSALLAAVALERIHRVDGDLGLVDVVVHQLTILTGASQGAWVTIHSFTPGIAMMRVTTPCTARTWPRAATSHSGDHAPRIMRTMIGAADSIAMTSWKMLRLVVRFGFATCVATPALSTA